MKEKSGGEAKVFKQFLVDKLPNHRPRKQHWKRGRKPTTLLCKISRLSIPTAFGEEYALGASEMKDAICAIIEAHRET